MTKLSRLPALAAGLILAGSIAACGNGGDDDVATPAATTPPTMVETTDPPTEEPTEDATEAPTEDATDDAMAGETATVTTAESDLGTILVDGDGMTLYLFTNDTPGVSNCEDACLEAWPPLLGEPEAGEGVDESLLGTLERSDGSTQVSYNGWPLYYWQNDAAPGDTTGQAVNDVWWVVSPEGEAIGAG